MSRREVETVATLAAHLAQRENCHRCTLTELIRGPFDAPQCAADALALQRLGRNIRAKAQHIERLRWGTYLMNMAGKAEKVLKPYGLVGVLSPQGIAIEGVKDSAGQDFSI